MMTLDEFTKFVDNTLNSAHDSTNANRVGHRDGFCLACAEIYVALNVGYISHKDVTKITVSYAPMSMCCCMTDKRCIWCNTHGMNMHFASDIGPFCGNHLAQAQDMSHGETTCQCGASDCLGTLGHK